MLLAEIVAVSRAVAATRARSEKTELLADLLRRVQAAEAAAAISFLSGSPTQRALGVGPATVYSIDALPAGKPSLEVAEVDRALAAIGATSGQGSTGRKREMLQQMFQRATSEEQDFLRGLILRNLRQGALEGLMADAVASALGLSADCVRRAAMLEGDLIGVAARALTEGPRSLAGSTLSPLTPVQPMLAKSAATVAEAMAGLGEALIEQKLDGLRLQVHRDGDDVAIFTRNLRDVTAQMPGVVEAARTLPASRFILDGEGLLLDEAGSPMAFQDSMTKAGEDTAGWPLEAFYFDALQIGDVELIDLPLRARREALGDLVPERAQVSAIVTSDEEFAEQFFMDSVDRGFEGAVVKDLEQPYEAGRRGSGWVKVKPTHTLDLVILAAEWGSGRRRGWLSNLHLGARDPDGGYVMLGKTFKGLTDEMLAWQTDRFLELEREREGHVVFLEPAVVYEVAFDGVQRSTRYPGGVALRFARVKRYRPDKSPADADTIDAVRSFLR